MSKIIRDPYREVAEEARVLARERKIIVKLTLTTVDEVWIFQY